MALNHEGAGGGDPAIMEASSKGDLEALGRLLAHAPALVTASFGRGWTPLMTASANGHVHVVEYLVK
jgi:ankyrin repeat protein